MDRTKIVLVFEFLLSLWQAAPLRTILTMIILTIKKILFILQLWGVIQIINSLIPVKNATLDLIKLYQHGYLLIVVVVIHQLLQTLVTYFVEALQETWAGLHQTKLIKAVALVPLHHKETSKYRRLLVDAEQAIQLNRTQLFTNLIQLIDLVLEIVCLILLVSVINWFSVALIVILLLVYLFAEVRNLYRQAVLAGHVWEEEQKADYIFELTTSKEASLEVRFFVLAKYLTDLWAKLVKGATTKLTRMAINKGVYVDKSWDRYLVVITWILVVFSSFVLLSLNLISLGGLIGLLVVVGRLDNVVSKGNQQLTEIMTYLSEYFTSLVSLLQAGTYAENVFGAGLCSAVAEDKLLTTPINKIEFKNVYFTYPDYSIGIRQASVTINKGEIVALVGPNGAGKSTFIKLLLGIYFPEKGKILVDGLPLHKDHVYHWWSRISVVFQDYARFDLTIRESVGLNRLNDQEIWEALNKVGMSELVNNLPAGLGTILGDASGGYQPSVGQWQRFALARAFAKSGDLIIFDEPFASLDVFAEEQIFQEFRRFSQGKTGIFVSHRLGPAKLADKIILFQAGKIVEVGNHQQLIAAGGLYAEMYATQAKGYISVE